VLAGQRLGIKEVDDGIWIVSFMHYNFDFIDLEQKTLQPLDNPFGIKAASPRETDSPLKGTGFEPSVPRLQWSSVQLAARDGTMPPSRSPGGPEGSNLLPSSRESGANLIFGDESHR
jgi:hypothetical protein